MAPASLGGLRPSFGPMSLGEAQDLLVGLVAVDERQIRSGVPLISAGLLSGQIRYIRSDPEERWLTIRDVWALGGGDCEDLAAALAASRNVLGMPSRVIVVKSRPGRRTAHAVVQDIATGRLLDPSMTGGMGWNE